MIDQEQPTRTTLKDFLKVYALPIAGGCFAVGGILAGASLVGYFNDQVRYCDGRTNPCTWVIAPDWMTLPPQAKFKKVEPGNKVIRILAGMGGAIAFPTAFVAFSVALANQRQIDETRERDKNLDDARAEILTDEEKQRLALAAELRVKDFQRQLLDGYAELYLLEHPELIDELALSQDSPQQPTESLPEPQEPEVQQLPQPESTTNESAPQVLNQSDVPQTNSSQPMQVSEQDLWTEYRQIGESIIRSMIVSDKSVLLASGTGTGKTTTEEYYLRQLLSRHPKAEVYALLNKNDSLYGVRNDRSLVFDPEWLDALPVGKDKGEERKEIIERSLLPLYNVYGIFLKRKKLPKEERNRLKETLPIRLILGDWYGTYQELQARLFPQEMQSVLSKTRQIITIGRDMGVGLYVDTQSDKLDAVGIAGDSSIRQSLDIYSQGFIYYEDGEEKGELQTMRLVFENSKICSSEERKEIEEAYRLLARAIKEGEINTPIIFTTVGSRPRVGIVPRLADFTTPTNISMSDMIQGLNRQYLQSEFMLTNLNVSPSEPTDQADIVADADPEIEQRLIELVNALSDKGSILVSQIPAHWKPARKLSESELNDLIDLLIERRLAEIDDTGKAPRIRII